MKKLLLPLLLLVFEITFSQNNKTISFLNPSCMGELVSGVSKNELYSYWSFIEVEKHNHSYFSVEKYDGTDSRKPKFFLKGLPFEESPVVGKYYGSMLFPGDHLNLSIPNLEDEKNSNSYYIYSKGDLMEKENNEFPFF